MTKVLRVCFCMAVLAACSSHKSADTPDVSKADALNAKADTDLQRRLCRNLGYPPECDICGLAGWYNDGECDTFCDQLDPDCSTAADAGPAPQCTNGASRVYPGCEPAPANTLVIDANTECLHYCWGEADCLGHGLVCRQAWVAPCDDGPCEACGVEQGVCVEADRVPNPCPTGQEKLYPGCGAPPQDVQTPPIGGACFERCTVDSDCSESDMVCDSAWINPCWYGDCQLCAAEVGICVRGTARPNDCIRSGCSGEICSDIVYNTTCDDLPEYACYADATCERQSDGACGWTQTAQLQSCLRGV